jgi:hypothetical protein
MQSVLREWCDTFGSLPIDLEPIGVSNDCGVTAMLESNGQSVIGMCDTAESMLIGLEPVGVIDMLPLCKMLCPLTYHEHFVDGEVT